MRVRHSNWWADSIIKQNYNKFLHKCVKKLDTQIYIQIVLKFEFFKLHV